MATIANHPAATGPLPACFEVRKFAKQLSIAEQAVANHKHFFILKLKDAVARTRLKNIDLAGFGISQ